MRYVTATRVVEFDAAHRVMNHESKCATIHGHRYKVEITAKAALDSIGRVIDFSVLKRLIGGWLDTEWDHTSILFDQDIETIQGICSCPGYKKPAVVNFNPTAENMASHLLHKICPELLKGTGVTVTKIKLWETPNCYAEAEL